MFCLVKILIKTHNSSFFKLGSNILVSIIKIQAKEIYYFYDSLHLVSRNTDQYNTSINQNVIHKFDKNVSLIQPITDHPDRI